MLHFDTDPLITQRFLMFVQILLHAYLHLCIKIITGQNSEILLMILKSNSALLYTSRTRLFLVEASIVFYREKIWMGILFYVGLGVLHLDGLVLHI